jgi:hypothetical protein
MWRHWKMARQIGSCRSSFRYRRFAAGVREDDPVVEGIVDNRSPRGDWPNAPTAPLTIHHKQATTPQRITGAIT